MEVFKNNLIAHSFHPPSLAAQAQNTLNACILGLKILSDLDKGYEIFLGTAFKSTLLIHFFYLSIVMEFSRPVSGLETVSRHIFETLVSVSPRTWTSSLDLESWSRKIMVSKYEKSRDSKSWLGVGIKFLI